MIFKCTIILVAGCTFSPTVVALEVRNSSKQLEVLDRAICGPRCVKFVLDFFERGADVELAELVREMQWPEFYRGTSLNEIARALQRREIYSKALVIDRGMAVDWDHPVILHMRRTNSDIGHFVVVLPSKNVGRVRIWSGLAGMTEIAIEELSASASTAILLTSRAAIEDSDATLACTSPPFIHKSAVGALYSSFAVIAMIAMAYCLLRSHGAMASAVTRKSEREI